MYCALGSFYYIIISTGQILLGHLTGSGRQLPEIEIRYIVHV